MAQVKEERLQVRVDPTAKRLLEEAAGALHLSLSAFVLQSAELRAEEVLAERQLLRLSPSAAQAFAEALSRPATVNERLRQTLSRAAGFSWLD